MFNILKLCIVTSSFDNWIQEKIARNFKKSYLFNQFHHSSWKSFEIKQNPEWRKKKKNWPTCSSTFKEEQNLPECSLNPQKTAQDSSLVEYLISLIYVPLYLWEFLF